MGRGTITSYALMSLEPRGTLFVIPGMEVGLKMISFYLLCLCLNNYMCCLLLHKYEQQRTSIF